MGLNEMKNGFIVIYCVVNTYIEKFKILFTKNIFGKFVKKSILLKKLIT